MARGGCEVLAVWWVDAPGLELTSGGLLGDFVDRSLHFVERRITPSSDSRHVRSLELIATAPALMVTGLPRSRAEGVQWHTPATTSRTSQECLLTDWQPP